MINGDALFASLESIVNMFTAFLHYEVKTISSQKMPQIVWKMSLKNVNCSFSLLLFFINIFYFLSFPYFLEEMRRKWIYSIVELQEEVDIRLAADILLDI